MPRTGKRRAIAHGIYADDRGIEAQVHRGKGKGNSRRFPLGTDLREMQRWQLRRETAREQEGVTHPAESRDALKDDVPAYLATLSGRKKIDAETLLTHWLNTDLAKLPRHEITPLMLRTQMAAWLTAKVSASSINHRLSALRALYRVLDENDLDAPNPTLKIHKVPEPEPEPREIPRTFVDAVFAAMPDRGRPTKGATRSTVSKTKLRLTVEATTGLPPKQIGRLQETHVDWRRKAVYVTPRRKGKGVKGKWLPLTDAGARALRAFFAGHADGAYSTSAAAKSFHRAVKAAKALYERKGWTIPPLPPKLRPYDFRHTFLTVAFRHSKDIRAVQELALHADPRMTERYMVGAVAENVRGAVRAVSSAARKPRKGAGTRWHRKQARSDQ